MIEVAIINQASPRCLADPCSPVFATTAGRVFGGMDSGARPRARRLRCFLWVAVVVGLVLPWTGLLHPTHTDAVAHWRGRRGSRTHGRSWRNLVLRKACSFAHGGCAAVRASSPPGFAWAGMRSDSWSVRVWRVRCLSWPWWRCCAREGVSVGHAVRRVGMACKPRRVTRAVEVAALGCAKVASAQGRCAQGASPAGVAPVPGPGRCHLPWQRQPGWQSRCRSLHSHVL